MRRLQGLVTIAASLALVGCLGIYGEISDLEDDAIVHESGPPADVNSNDYGVGFGFGGSAGDGLKFLAFGNSPGGVALLSFDATGRLTSDGNPLPPGFDFPERPPIAGLPSDIASNQNVVAGANAGADSGVILYSPNALENEVDVLNIMGGNIVGVGIGSTDGGTPNVDVVASSGNNLHLFDGRTEPSLPCVVVDAADVPQQVGRLVVTDLGGPALDEIAVIAGDVVHIFTGPNVAAGGNCQAADHPAPTNAAVAKLDVVGGADIITGDFNGDGTNDLAISTPGASQVVVILDPLNSATTLTVGPAAGSEDFAFAIAAGDLNSDGRDELIIGAPETDVDGTAAAGVVEIHEFMGDAFLAPVILRRAQPETNERYGRAVGVAAFADTADRLLVGADQKIFVNFVSPLTGDEDPR